jgi:hypothetical protein
MVFSLYDALDRTRDFTVDFNCKLPLGSNTSLVVTSKKASGYEIGVSRNKSKAIQKIYGGRYDTALPDDLVERADMVVYLVVLGLRDYFSMVNTVIGKVEEAMLTGIRIGRHPKSSINDALDKFSEINEKFSFMIGYTNHLKDGITSYLEEIYYPISDGYLGLHNPFLYRNVVRQEIGRWGEDNVHYVNIGIPDTTSGKKDDYIYITINESTKPEFDLAFGAIDDHYYFGASTGALECDSLSYGLYHYIEALSNMAVWTKSISVEMRSSIRQLLGIVSNVNSKYNTANEILLLEKAFSTEELFVFYMNMLRQYMSK